MHMKYIGYILITVLVILGLYFWSWEHTTQYKTIVLTMGGESFSTEIADTPAKQQLGLSYRDSITSNNAMLFVFPVAGNYQFWMKDMNFPIDIMWLDSGKKIIYIEKNLSPATYPQSFGPAVASQYVIEVANGTADRLRLSLGDNVLW